MSYSTGDVLKVTFESFEMINIIHYLKLGLKIFCPSSILHGRNALLGKVSSSCLEKNRTSKPLLAGKFVLITLLAGKEQKSFLGTC